MATLIFPASPSLFAVERNMQDEDDNDTIPELKLSHEEDESEADSSPFPQTAPQVSSSLDDAAKAVEANVDSVEQIDVRDEEQDDETGASELAKTSTALSEPECPPNNTTAEEHETEPLATDPVLIDMEMNAAISSDVEHNDSADAMPGGLSNLGNTCYMASAIQMLSSLEPLMQQLLEQQKQQQEDESNNVLDALLEVSSRLNKGETVHPEGLKSALDERSPLFCGYEQQDAHEFITTLLDLLDEDYKKQQQQQIEEAKEKEMDAENETKEEVLKQEEATTPIVTSTEVVKTDEKSDNESVEDDVRGNAAPTTSGDTHPATPVDLYSNKRLKTLGEFPSEEKSTSPTGTTTRRESHQAFASSFSQLNVDGIGQLLHGIPAVNESARPRTSSVSSSSSSSEPKCKLVGGRMSLELTRDTVLTTVEHDAHNPDGQEDPTSSLVESQSTSEQQHDETISSPVTSNTAEENVTSEVRSPIDEYLTTEVCVKLTCDSCRYASSHKEKFWHLSLELDGNNQESSVQDGLARFFAPEQRELKCEKCFAETATQTMQITKLPAALLFHFKRFIVEVSDDYTSVSYRKNSTPVSYETSIEVKARHPWEDENHYGAEPADVLSDFLAPNCTVPNKTENRLCCETSSRCPTSWKYELTSVVNHIGSSASCGHYTADGYRNHEWLRFNDSYVSKITSHQSTRESASTAYMIMYEMV
mmetsp:Transcript_4063/g.8876  ORF Transcript_4063/g.8876 Transcript_4063/m.8876 type:complete len:705 (-) Transcript_4063:76-2190(-)